MKLAIVYARYSSERQTEQSIEGQLDVCQKYAEQNGLQIVNTYIDRAMTGTNDNRAAFQQMLSDSQKALWEIVIVYALDRFGRNSIEMALNKKKLIDNGKILVSATQKTSTNIDGTKNLDGIMLENIYTGVAEYFSAELAQKIRRGLAQSYKKGQYCGGGLPYGYCKDKQLHIHIDEDRAQVVRYIYEQYALGVTVPEIVRSLTYSGLVNGEGRPFSKNGIYNILKNEKYSGIYKTKSGLTLDNMYPRIVPQNTYEKVRAITNQNKSGKRSVVTNYLLRFKVKCGYCGSPISADCGKSRLGVVRHYYGCRGRKKLKNGCKKASIRKELLEQIVIDAIQKELSKPEVMSALIKRIMEAQKKSPSETPMLNTFKKELKDVERALDNLVSALENGISSQTTNKRLHELETKKDEITAKILIEDSKTATILSEADIREYFAEAIRLEPQAAVNELVKQIVLFDDRLEIQFNTPANNNPDESQGCCFYSEKMLIPTYDYDCRTAVMAEMEKVFSI